MYIALCQSYVISKVHACTFVTCSLNVIDWLITVAGACISASLMWPKCTLKTTEATRFDQHLSSSNTTTLYRRVWAWYVWVPDDLHHAFVLYGIWRWVPWRGRVTLGAAACASVPISSIVLSSSDDYCNVSLTAMSPNDIMFVVKDRDSLMTSLLQLMLDYDLQITAVTWSSRVIV